MKTQQTFPRGWLHGCPRAADHTVAERSESTFARAHAAWPTLTAVAIAIASSVVLTLAGCASSAGLAPSARLVDPASAGLGASAAVAAPAAASNAAATEKAAMAAPESPLAADWWLGFGDATLDALVDRALAGNPNLRVAQARVTRADAAVGNVRAAGGARLEGQIDASRQRISGTGIYPPPLGGAILNLGTTQLSATWEPDFFGRNRAAIEAAIGSQRAAEADMQAARIMLAANVARTYVQLGRLFEQRAVASRALQQRDETLALINQRVRGGLDTAVEQRQGEGALPETRQQIEELDEQIALTRHALAALTAQPPDTFDGMTVQLDGLRPVAVPTILPTDLLGRRADITAARWRIEAAIGDVKNAKAQFYPNVNLTAFAGFSSIGFDQLFKAASEQYGAGPAIRLPIFDSGRLRANLRVRDADLDNAVESYNGAVFDAVHDAADQLGSIASIARQRTLQADTQKAAESAYDLALQRYRAGLGTYLTVLNAEATVLAQRRLAADLKARTLDVQIALIRALGGGYAGDTELLARGTPTFP